MDNLYELRQNIKYRLAFEDKLKSQSNIIQFFLTLRNLYDYHNRYNAPAVPERRGYGIFASLYNRKRVPAPKELYPTFDDYLYKVVFKSHTPPDYLLVTKPSTFVSLSEIDICLSRWSDIVRLYSTVQKKIHDSNNSELNLVDGEPSVITLEKLLNTQDYTHIFQPGSDKINFPFVSFLPLRNIWKYNKYDFKEFLQVGLFFLIIAILGIIGIILDEQPYTWLGAAAVSIVVAIFIGTTIYNIVTLFTKGTPQKGEWIPGTIGFASGLVLFFCSYSVTPPPTSNYYYSSPQETDAYYDNAEDNVIVYTTEYGECYHSTPNCPSLYRSRNIYETTKKRAKRSYRPCQRCH